MANRTRRSRQFGEVVAVRLQPSARRALEELAKYDDVSVSTLIRRVVIRFLSEHPLVRVNPARQAAPASSTLSAVTPMTV